PMIEWVGAISLFIGTVLMFLASVGILRLPDLFTRMHAVAKAGTAGVGLIMVAVICFHPEIQVVTRALAVLFFIALTASISAHMIGRAAYITGVHLWKGTFVDQLREYREAQRRRARKES